MNSRAECEARGRRGEWLAGWYLRLKGWRIVASRVQAPRGEVDLVVRRGRLVAIAEVKLRASAQELELRLTNIVCTGSQQLRKCSPRVMSDPAMTCASMCCCLRRDASRAI